MDPELWPQDEDARRWRASKRHVLQEGRLVEVRQARKVCGGTQSDDAATAEGEDANCTEPEALAIGRAPLSHIQLLPVQTMQNPMDTELATLSQRACTLIPALEKFLNILLPCHLHSCQVLIP